MAAPSKKVVLFLPQRTDPKRGDLPCADLLPLELLQIAGPAIRDGYDVRLVDAMVEPNYLERVLAECDGALCFGSSCILGYQVYDGYVVSKAVRERYPRLPIFQGGWFPSVIPELYFRFDVADAVCLGQGEYTFPEMLAAASNGESLEKVAGLALWREGELVRTAARKPVDWNDVPKAPFELLDLEAYYRVQRKDPPPGHRIRHKFPDPPGLEGKKYRGISYFLSLIHI